MIKHLVKRVKEFLSNKRHYDLSLSLIDYDYKTAVGEVLAKGKLTDHVAGTEDFIYIRLNDHGRYAFRWLTEAGGLKIVGDYCTERHESPVNVLNDIFSTDAHLSRWTCRSIYGKFDDWFSELDEYKRGVSVDYDEDTHHVVIQVCNPYGNHVMIVNDANDLSEASFRTAAEISNALMRTNKIRQVMIFGTMEYYSLGTLARRLERLIEKGAKVADMGNGGDIIITIDNETVILTKVLVNYP